MKIKTDANISSEDLPSINLGLYHTIKKSTTENMPQLSGLEKKLEKEANDVFDVFISNLLGEIINE